MEKTNPEVFEFNKEEEKEILRRAGCKDLLELMTCKNCLSFGNKDGKSWCSENNQETSADENCGYWTEKINTGVNENLLFLYIEIKNVLKEFIDTKEDNYEIITLWIMGTWMHRYFPTYPYLFINAMKGSGKTRLLKLIKELSWNGDMLASLSDAVLFRTTGTLCIDEFENVSGKDKNSLRELLNTAYKQGGKVKRMKKVKNLTGDEQVVEEFSTFRPLVIANIKGMEEVLGDRCIDVVLEKSNNKVITRMIEDFQTHDVLVKLRNFHKKNTELCSLCSVVTEKNIYTDWNTYIKITTPNYTYTYTTPNYNTTREELFKKIFDTDIDGRNLELTFPLLLISAEIGLTDKFIDIIKRKITEKKSEDFYESRDIMVYSLVAKQTGNDWYKIKELVGLMRQQIDFDVNEEHWLNEKWMGRALKRLNLVREKKRIGEGIEVILYVDKAKEKLQIFN